MRKEFFETTINFETLEQHAKSNDPSLRWASTIELGQLGTEEAISLLWSLTTDSDDNVRDAANFGLQQCDQALVGKILASKWVAPQATGEKTGLTDQLFVAWKVRPLEEPSSENEWAVDAAILNIIQVEGPINGSRLLRLYGNAAFPNNPRKIPKSRIQSAIKRLEKRKLIQRLSNSVNHEIENWTMCMTGQPEVNVRTQGPRKLHEIPVTEVVARIRNSLGESFEYTNQNDRVRELMNLYGIKQSELHILGSVMANEWADLLSI